MGPVWHGAMAHVAQLSGGGKLDADSLDTLAACQTPSNTQII